MYLLIAGWNQRKIILVFLGKIIAETLFIMSVFIVPCNAMKIFNIYTVLFYCFIYFFETLLQYTKKSIPKFKFYFYYNTAL